MKVAVVRNEDLEARELKMFDELERLGALSATAFGLTPRTPYGIQGIEIPIHILHSPLSMVARLPLGETIASRLLGGPLVLERSIGLSRRLRGFDVINTRETFQPQSAQVAQMLRRSSQARSQRLVVSCFENIPFRYDDDERLAWRKAVVREAADLLVANSPGAQRALELEGVEIDRIVVIPPSVDTELFSPGPPDREVRQRWGASPSDIVLLYAGRLLREKGLVELLIAVAPLLRERSDVLLVFHGQGPESGRLERAARAMGVADRIRFSPWIETSSMPAVYRSANVVLLPSLATPYWSEQFGFNLAEAMAAGRPIAAACSGEIPWVLGDGGVVFDERSANDVRRTVDALVRDEATRRQLGEAARRIALARYTAERAGLDLVQAFHDSLGRPRRSKVPGHRSISPLRTSLSKAAG